MVRLNFLGKQKEKKTVSKEKKTEEKRAPAKEEISGSGEKPSEGFLFLVKRPLLTEKATRHQELNKYFFEVLKGANKSEIKKQIERYYRVKVKKVNIIKGKKRKKKWMRIVGREPKYKKAIVTLEEGYKIDIGV